VHRTRTEERRYESNQVGNLVFSPALTYLSIKCLYLLSMNATFGGNVEQTLFGTQAFLGILRGSLNAGLSTKNKTHVDTIQKRVEQAQLPGSTDSQPDGTNPLPGRTKLSPERL
jgi:hypothetical protein